MVIKNAKSNPLYHFIEVIGTNEELAECDKWCTAQFGLFNDRLWNKDIIPEPEDTIRIAVHKTPIFSSKKMHEYRYRFAKIEHRDWFVLRWT
jgi:hypothetical protein